MIPTLNSVEENEQPRKINLSEAHVRLEYKAYKTEIEKRRSYLLAKDSTCVVDAVVAQKRSRHAVMWEKVCKDAEKQVQKVEKSKETVSEGDLQKVTAREYLDVTVFPVLLPVLEDVLRRAEENDCLKVQKCKFNGIDYIVEQIWNRNPKHPERASDRKTVFEIPFVKEWLDKHPRPIYPLSWLWSREEAAVIIQSNYRGYLVRRNPEVQEMRQFWKALEAEREEALRKKKEAQQHFQLLMQEKAEHLKDETEISTITIEQDELDKK